MLYSVLLTLHGVDKCFVALLCSFFLADMSLILSSFKSLTVSCMNRQDRMDQCNRDVLEYLKDLELIPICIVLPSLIAGIRRILCSCHPFHFSSVLPVDFTNS